MKKLDIEELQFFIAETLEKDEFVKRHEDYELKHPSDSDKDAYSLGVAVGVSRARYALEKFLSIDHASIVDSILIDAEIKKSYRDGNQFCILLGEDLQSGICGFGKTKKEALIDFLKAVRLSFVSKRNCKPSKAQSEADLENYFKGWHIEEEIGLTKPDGWSCTVDDIKGIARHFYELGLKARKEGKK